MNGQPRSVDSIAGPYANFLVPVPRRAPGVCGVCRRGVEGTYPTCPKCALEPLGVGRGGADVVAFVALAPSQNQLAYELVNYKRVATPPSMRQRFSTGLAAVLWKWLALHEGCLAREAGVPDFPVVTTVPTSSSGRTAPHPLVTVVSQIVQGSGMRYRPLLQPSGVPVAQRQFSRHRFNATAALAGEPVLIVDDTWTTGAHAHGAAAALRAAGSGRVAVLAIGRWYHPDDTRNTRVEQQRRGRRWSWDECLFDP